MFSANTSQVSADQVYVEDVFSTYLYTGSGSTRTISNGIDLSGKGGLVWIKRRDTGYSHFLYDTARGTTKSIYTDGTTAQETISSTLTAFGSSGFTVGSDSNVNGNNASVASWTFREAPKFFDVVTYTGNGANRNIAHNLGVAPGCIIVKRTDTAADWQVYHRSNANTEYMVLNTTAAKATGTTRWNSTTPTATEFTVGTDTTVNASGGTYVAYLFAHDTTSDGIIQCGSASTDSSGNWSATTGWEPQWVMFKSSTGASHWEIVDNMRDFSVTENQRLFANLSNAEAGSGGPYLVPNSTGFAMVGSGSHANGTAIYIAIRRGPMRTPTSGTSVYNAIARTGTGSAVSLTGAGFPPDLYMAKTRAVVGPTYDLDRLRGTVALTTSSTSAEGAAGERISAFEMDGVTLTTFNPNASSTTYINYFFRRAPSFFDEVCYTGTGVAGRTVNHNLGVVPELMIVKSRGTNDWAVYNSASGATHAMYLNSTTDAFALNTFWNDTNPTSSVFTVGTRSQTNESGVNFVAYLFASCPGVSKVGSYTGNGSSQTINCGFAAGARFVMIKRTDSTGDWYVWDTARGIVSGDDPHLSLNSTAAEVTTDDSVDTDSSGFVVNQLSATNINVSSATYIYLAVA